MNAVSYLRVSGKGQVDGDGLPRQRESIERFATRCGFHIAREFTDQGVSGARELDERAGLANLIAFVEAEKITHVLVERADRLARDLMVSEMILDRFRRLGVTVIAVDSDTDLTVTDNDPTRTMVRQILGAVAQFNKTMTVAQTRAARDRVRKSGRRCEGAKPYGMKEGEAATLEIIRGMVRSHTQVEIAAHLNSQGLKTRFGRPWSRANIKEIVRGIRKCK